jgi:hypothetical protein
MQQSVFCPAACGGSPRWSRKSEGLALSIKTYYYSHWELVAVAKAYDELVAKGFPVCLCPSDFGIAPTEWWVEWSLLRIKNQLFFG